MNQFITIISSCFLLSFVYSFFLHKKNIPLSLNKRAFLLRTVTQNTVGDSSSQENADEDKMTRMIELIVSSVEEGREDDLRRAGLKVTKKSARETLDDKLIDPEIQNTIFGPMTSEDKSVMEMLERVCQQEQNLDSSSVTTTTDKSSSSITNGIDSAMFAELKEEAMQTLEELRRKGSVMGALLDDQEQFGTTINPLIRPSTIHPSNSQQIPTTSSSTVDDKVIPGGAMDPSVWGTSTPGVESMLSPVDPMKYIEWMNEGYEGPLIVGAAVEEMECDEPEPSTDETTPVANPLYNGGNGVAGSQHYELPIRNSVTQQFMNTVTATTTATTTTTDTTTTTTATTDPKALSVEALLMNPGLSDSPNSLESKFAALLKASMNAQQVQAEVGATDSNSKDSLVLTRKNLVEAVTTGQSNGIDIETLLGSTMASLAKQLNVNVADTLSEKDSMAEMQMILGGGMAELTATLNEVDEEAVLLYKKLETLGDDIRNETEVFEQTKQLELDLFLQSQNAFQNEVVLSKRRVQNTTDTLRNVVQNLEEEADVITALALFPLKSVDKKAAFVVGLALALKLPFDTVKIAFNSLDSSDWFGIVVQAGVCLACLNHYGILKALGKKSKDLK